jgi:hypothetical protein
LAAFSSAWVCLFREFSSDAYIRLSFYCGVVFEDKAFCARSIFINALLCLSVCKMELFHGAKKQILCLVQDEVSY